MVVKSLTADACGVWCRMLGSDASCLSEWLVGNKQSYCCMQNILMQQQRAVGSRGALHGAPSAMGLAVALDRI